MADFPYTQSPGNIKKLFNEIQSAGKPEKVQQTWLEMHGLKSKNDRRLVPLIKFLGFADDGGKPNDDIWLEYKHKEKSRALMAQQVRTAYSDLFSVYPDANRKDDEALRNYFSSKTGLASNVVGFTVSTFKSLCELAEFEFVPPDMSRKRSPREEKGDSGVRTRSGSDAGSLTVNVNIQLQIAATDDASIYDKFFESLYKNVLAKSRES